MKVTELSFLPEWPALMDVETTVLYLGGKLTIYQFLCEKGYLKPLADRKRVKVFRRGDIDIALDIAQQNSDDLKPEGKGSEA